MHNQSKNSWQQITTLNVSVDPINGIYVVATLDCSDNFPPHVKFKVREETSMFPGNLQSARAT